MYLKLETNVNGAPYWTLRGANHEILATSEAYSSKSNCVQTIKAVASQLRQKFDPAQGISVPVQTPF